MKIPSVVLALLVACPLWAASNNDPNRFSNVVCTGSPASNVITVEPQDQKLVAHIYFGHVQYGNFEVQEDVQADKNRVVVLDTFSEGEDFRLVLTQPTSTQTRFPGQIKATIVSTNKVYRAQLDCNFAE